MTDWRALAAATRDTQAPYAVVDLDALDANANDLVRRANGTPIRLASKSIRCRSIVDRVLQAAGFKGIMAYSLPEAIWLAEGGSTDILVAYPSVDRDAWRKLAAAPDLARQITVMIDEPAHLDLIDSCRGDGEAALRLCIDVDASLRIGPIHLGVRRSPVRTAEQALALVADAGRRRGLAVVALMFYDAQVAGMPDSSAAVRKMKAKSLEDLLTRRTAIVDALRDACDLQIVNGGGTGSLHSTGRDAVLTELAAGSGLYGPTLFDRYDDFTPTPAAFFALPVVRRPSTSHATVFSGGYIASGAIGKSRVPTPVWPAGLSLIKSEGTGEVQTPLTGSAAKGLRVGDVVWFRHAKAGELCERFDDLLLVRGEELVARVPTYRGERMNFG